MDKDRIDDWARKNKKQIVKEYLSKNEYKSFEEPSVIFMAGVPGAGKTEFAKRLIPQLKNKPLHIDMDEIATHIESYKPKIAHLFRSGASIILERLYDRAIKLHIDILMDGTLGHSKVMQNIERAVEHEGYIARIYFISQSPLIAWKKTKDRQLIEHREINPVTFVDSYFNLLSNLRDIQYKYGEKVPITVVLKNDDNRLNEIIENVKNINYYTQPILTRDALIDKIRT
jgi:ribosomal protein S8